MQLLGVKIPLKPLLVLIFKNWVWKNGEFCHFDER